MTKKIISFSGKGGVGKSTLLVLLLKILNNDKRYKDILVIDADPDSNIGDLIGQKIKFEDTISGKMIVLRKKIEKMQIPLTTPKNQIIENDIFESLIEMDDFDLLELGYSKIEGCYCSINNALKHIIDNLAKNYDIVLIDCPAGLEHLSRLTTKSATDLIIVVDPSKMSLHTLERILEISKALNIGFKHIWVLGNRYNEKFEKLLAEKIESIDSIKLIGTLPYDEKISEVNLIGDNLLELSDTNEFFKRFKQLIENSGILSSV